MLGSRAAFLSVSSLVSLVSLISLGVACGGKVVVDATTGDGGGGASSSASAGTTTVATGTGGCAGMEADLIAKVAAAQTCDPQGSSAQCSGLVVVFNGCSCVLAASTQTPDLAAEAVNAFNAWVSAGCGPIPCLLCPPAPAPDAPWFCDPATNRCSPHL